MQTKQEIVARVTAEMEYALTALENGAVDAETLSAMVTKEAGHYGYIKTAGMAAALAIFNAEIANSAIDKARGAVAR
ncbi:hypothetical protein R69746_08576 [Paraburkholderia aspalathi]|uniref:hypothetical protein n=1 Tax=Paraburkholderia aspalathi TaxID=1324617 RepID=UPI00190CAA3F|nr:hypothetical protein [Paraburkholderia aspalathi]MBK3844476.1 hypothetical protein [Paraburkholderia aspalathi]CAE6873128.1 hypothetical protein R69746_08576 [Paraburkholderia aspalathi]CAE6873940.1 hypothetical protein R75465_08476 [Paraburkholderia aspalathi]